MSMPEVENEEIYCEQACPIPGIGSPLLLTVVVRDDARGQIARESHVFLPQEERHLHEIVWLPCDRDGDDATLAGCIRATHRLFARQLAARAAGGDFSYVTRHLATPPFQAFGSQDKFRDEMQDIQAWTISRVLREALSRATRRGNVFPGAGRACACKADR